MRQHEMSPSALTPGRIARFWLPLEATWLMMAAEGPFLAAVIARLAGPKENLAAFAVATALAWMVESPIIMMLSASNALVRDGVAYRKLRRFSNVLNGAVTAVMIVLVIPPVFDLVARGVMGLTPDLAAPGRAVDDLPRPLAGGHRIPPLLPGHPHQRRAAAGRDLGNGHPALDHGRDRDPLRPGLPHARRERRRGRARRRRHRRGGGQLVHGPVDRSGVCAARIRRIARSGTSLTAGKVVRFYAPLALTSFLSFFINPLTTFFLARGRMPLESLAVLPVIVGLAFVFRTAGIAMQEVVIALVGDGGENRRILGRFTVRVGAASTIGLAAVVFTPLATVWYGTVSGLSPDLVAFSLLPGAFLVLIPFIEAILSYQRGVLVKSHRTDADQRGRGGPAGRDDGGVRRDGPRPEDGGRCDRRARPDRGLCGRGRRSHGRGQRSRLEARVPRPVSSLLIFVSLALISRGAYGESDLRRFP